MHFDKSTPSRVFTRVFVETDGALSVERTNFQDMRQRTMDGYAAANEIVDLSSLYPVSAYHSLTYQQPDPRRMNKVANGMFWELSEPTEADMNPLRVIKMRGTVAFLQRAEDLDGAHLARLREVHERVSARLAERGWI